MSDERQPQVRPSAPSERDATLGALAGDGSAPAARIRDDGALVLTLLAPAGRPPVAVTVRRDGDDLVAVLQPTIARGEPTPRVPFSYVLPVPAGAPAARVHVTGLGGRLLLPLTQG